MYGVGIAGILAIVMCMAMEGRLMTRTWSELLAIVLAGAWVLVGVLYLTPVSVM